MEAAADKLDNAKSVCDHILDKRVKQSDECKAELLDAIRTGVAMHAWLIRKQYHIIGKSADDQPFQMWLNNARPHYFPFSRGIILLTGT